MTSAWDPQNYQEKHSYVWRYGESLIELLQPRAGERILDVGCGTGQLTAEIAKCGARLVGLDQSAEMLNQARRNYPELTFVLNDAARFRFAEPFDAVFSNAALHWVKDAAGAAESIARALREGGRFVAEFGGKGNTASILSAFRAVFGPGAEERSPWFYPSIGQYASLLERHGLEVRQASLFDRPTPLEGPNAMEQWLAMFCGNYLREVGGDNASAKIPELVDFLRPRLLRDGVWIVDHVRLRLVAVKVSSGSA